MDEKEFRDAIGEFEQAVPGMADEQYVLRLYVAGTTPRSNRAIEAIKELCEKELEGRYDLEVIDIYQHPDLMEEQQVLAVPALIKKLPLPLRKIIGDMSDTERVVVGLGLRPKS